MTVEEIRSGLLEALAKVAQQHGTLQRNPLPEGTPTERHLHLSDAGIRVTTAKYMCRVAGVPENEVRLTIDLALKG